MYFSDTVSVLFYNWTKKCRKSSSWRVIDLCLTVPTSVMCFGRYSHFLATLTKPQTKRAFNATTVDLTVAKANTLETEN